MENNAYKNAGVDINAGDELVDRISPLAKSTNRLGTMGTLGGFGALFDLKKLNYKDPILVSSTDGVGTKLKIAQAMNKHDTIGIDLVAMCVNDLVVQGAEPLFFLDYFATGKLDVKIAEQVISGIVEGCKQAGCALVGGETAEMPGMYQNGEYDLAGFAVGVVERDKILPKNVQEGEIILSLPSSGLHSNGYSLVRKIIKQNSVDALSLEMLEEFSGNTTFHDNFIIPTKIYVKECLSAIQAFPDSIHALAHITGGGLLGNLPRVIPDDLTFELFPRNWFEIQSSDWKIPLIFNWLRVMGKMSEQEMFYTFNCGVGMAVIIEKNKLSEISNHFLQIGMEKIHIIGEIVKK